MTERSPPNHLTTPTTPPPARPRFSSTPPGVPGVTSAGGAEAKGDGSNAAPSATYELYYQPDAAMASGGVGPGAADAAASEAARFRSLEQRVAGLEGWLGEGRSGHGAVAAPDAGAAGDAGNAGAGLYGTMRGLTGAVGEGGECTRHRTDPALAHAHTHTRTSTPHVRAHIRAQSIDHPLFHHHNQGV